MNSWLEDDVVTGLVPEWVTNMAQAQHCLHGNVFTLKLLQICSQSRRAWHFQ